jgi:hypothetical protein
MQMVPILQSGNHNNLCLRASNPLELFVISKKTVQTGLAFVTCGLVALSAEAGPVTVLGNDGLANGAVNASGAAATTRTAFLATLSDFNVETLESQTATTAPTAGSPLSILSGGGTLAPVTGAVGTGTVANTNTSGSGAFTGRFNTTPTPFTGPIGQWWQTNRSFTLTLGTAASAFGFYATDLGDFRGALDIDICLGVGPCTSYSVSPTSGANGSLLFFGYTNDLSTFDRLVFKVSQLSGLMQGQYDVIGFDDLVVGNLRSTSSQIPEPGSLALVAVSIGLLSALRRKPRA